MDHYMAMFLITGSHIDAEIARANAHRTRCSICGDAIEADDETYEDRGAIAHRQCCEAAAEIGYSEAGIW